MADAQVDLLGIAIEVVVVVRLDVGVARGERGLQGGNVDEHEPEPALLRHQVVVGVLVEQRGHVLVRRVQPLAEVVGPERDRAQADALVAADVLALDLVVADRDPVGERRLQPLEHQRPPHALLELGRAQRRLLHPQHLEIGGLADERAVLLEGGERNDGLPHLRVADGHAEARGFLQRRVLVDHLLQQLPVDAHGTQEVCGDLTAGLDLVALELAAKERLELADGDLLVPDLGQHVGQRAGGLGGGLDQGEPEDQQGETGEGEGPLQPRLVASHAIQHRHRVLTPCTVAAASSSRCASEPRSTSSTGPAASMRPAASPPARKV